MDVHRHTLSDKRIYLVLEKTKSDVNLMEAGAVHFKSLSGKTYILLLGYQSEEPSQSDLVLPLSGMQTSQKRQKKNRLWRTQM